MAEFFKNQEPTQRRMVFEPDDGPKGEAPGVGDQGSQVRDQSSGVGNRSGGSTLWPPPSAPKSEFEQVGDFPTTAASGLPVSRNGGSPQNAAPAAEQSLHLPPPRSAVVQIHNTYLVCQTDDGLIIVDQHALHERIIYETLLARLAGPTTPIPPSSSDRVASSQTRAASAESPRPPEPPASSPRLQSQPMLIPQRVTLGARQAALLFDAEHEPLLARLGLELTCFGPDEVAICAFPSLLGRVDPAAFVRDLADKLADEPPSSPEEFMHEVLDMMACKAAIKAGDPLTPAEINALLAQRDLVERSSNCPHGRPTTLKFSLAELEKQFHRR
jgi:DNA mismatch repair protein MutL